MSYPKDQLEFEDQFRTETDCVEYFKQIRWPKGFMCRKCGESEYWPQSRSRYTCKICNFQSTLYSGTMFECSRLKLRLWYRAIWWMINQKHGTSAAGLQKGLGIKSYKTAWLMLHKIRSAMVDPRRLKLSGNIEVDEAWVGGKKHGFGSKGSKENPIVVVAIEFNEKSLGRLRMEHIELNTTFLLTRFIENNIEQDSHLYTDEWSGYKSIQTRGYKHTATASSRAVDNNVLPRVHLVIALLKTWLQGTHHGRIERKHLQAYLDEFVFRFNRRNSASRGLLFKRLLESAIYGAGPTYEKITRKVKL